MYQQRVPLGESIVHHDAVQQRFTIPGNGMAPMYDKSIVYV